MANLIEGILKDFDEEFGSGSNLEHFSSAQDVNDFSIHQQNNSVIQNSYAQQQSNSAIQNSYTQQQNNSAIQNSYTLTIAG